MKALRKGFWIACAMAIGGAAAGTYAEQKSRSRVDPYQVLSHGIHASAVLSDNVEAVGAKSDLVVVGTVVNVAAGRTINAPAGDPGAVYTAVLEVEVSDVLKGSAPAGRIYIEEFRSSMTDPENVAIAFEQSKARTLFFLESEAWFALRATTKVFDAGKGRPAGTPLYRISSVQGTVVEATDGVVQPLAPPEARLYKGDGSFDDAVALTRTAVANQQARTAPPAPAEPDNARFPPPGAQDTSPMVSPGDPLKGIVPSTERVNQP